MPRCFFFPVLQGGGCQGYGLCLLLLDPGDYVLNPDLQMYPTVATSVVPVYNLNADVNLTLSARDLVGDTHFHLLQSLETKLQCQAAVNLRQVTNRLRS